MLTWRFVTDELKKDGEVLFFFLCQWGFTILFAIEVEYFHSHAGRNLSGFDSGNPVRTPGSTLNRDLARRACSVAPVSKPAPVKLHGSNFEITGFAVLFGLWELRNRRHLSDCSTTMKQRQRLSLFFSPLVSRPGLLSSESSRSVSTPYIYV